MNKDWWAEIVSFQEEKNKKEIKQIIIDAQDKINSDQRINSLCFNISSIVNNFLDGDSIKVCVTLTMFWFIDETRRLLDLYEAQVDDVYHTRNYVNQNYW